MNDLIKVDGDEIGPPVAGGAITGLQHVDEVVGVLSTRH